MMYEIFEGNMPRLAKRLTTIEHKCSKYGCEFHFDILGESFHEILDETSGKKIKTRFVQVEASGLAQVGPWEFVASIEHSKPFNVIRSFRPEVEIPTKYYTTEAVCEHCNTKRNRKDTYLVRNTQTGEFKQVGKSCLMDFTNGLDAEAVTRYMSWFDTLIKGEAPLGGKCTPYYEVSEVLQYAVEAVNIYGYRSTSSEDESTKEVVVAFLRGFHKDMVRHQDKGFEVHRQGNEEKVQQVLQFVKELPDQFGYISNLKTLCSKECCEGRDLGIVVSAVSCYNREMEKKQRKAKEEAVDKASSWVGEEGKRVELNGLSVKLLTSWDGMYGVTYMYKLVDQQGNIFVWKTSACLWDEEQNKWLEQVSLKGTVKAHSEFHGIKQTELTRCRVK